VKSPRVGGRLRLTKARKGGTFGLEEVVEALLDLVEGLVGVDEGVEQVGCHDLEDDVGVLAALAHAVHEEFVDLARGRMNGEDGEDVR
jgi:hypothetical protein